MGMSSDVFYSLLEDRRLQIQGKAAFDQSDKVQLGANIFKDGIYTIALENVEGVFASSQDIYLKDHLLNKEINLKAQSYTFQATKGITEGRFEIVYVPQTVLATGEAAKDDLMVYRNGTFFVLRSSVKDITDVEVYDMSGRLQQKIKGTRSRELQLNASAMNTGVYILRINRGGEILTRKIIK